MRLPLVFAFTLLCMAQPICAENGDLELTFGNDGIVTTPVTNFQKNNNFGFAIALQADGKILGAGGRSDDSEVGDAAIVRYLD